MVAGTTALTENYLYYANRERLVHVNRDGSGTQILLNTTDAIAVDYDIRYIVKPTYIIFWESLYSCKSIRLIAFKETAFSLSCINYKVTIVCIYIYWCTTNFYTYIFFKHNFHLFFLLVMKVLVNT